MAPPGYALAGYTAIAGVAGIVAPLVAASAITGLPPNVFWRAILLVPVPFMIAVIVISTKYLPRPARTKASADLDLVGIGLLGALVVLVTISVIDPGTPWRATVLIGTVVVLLGADTADVATTVRAFRKVAVVCAAVDARARVCGR